MHEKGREEDVEAKNNIRWKKEEKPKGEKED